MRMSTKQKLLKRHNSK